MGNKGKQRRLNLSSIGATDDANFSSRTSNMERERRGNWKKAAAEIAIRRLNSYWPINSPIKSTVEEHRFAVAMAPSMSLKSTPFEWDPLVVKREARYRVPWAVEAPTPTPKTSVRWAASTPPSKRDSSRDWALWSSSFRRCPRPTSYEDSATFRQRQ